MQPHKVPESDQQCLIGIEPRFPVQSPHQKDNRRCQEDDSVMHSGSSSHLSNEDVGRRYMERCKLESIVTFLNRQVGPCVNMMPDKNESHLPFCQKKEVYALFCKAFWVPYPLESLPTPS